MKSSCCQPNTKEGKNINEVSDFIAALNEPTRLKILCLLKQGERCVCDIYEPFGLPQNLVSHHLKALRDTGLIDYKKEGTKVVYFRNEKNVADLQKLLISIIKL